MCLRRTRKFPRPRSSDGSYYQLRQSKNDFKCTTDSVWCYRGAVVAPTWKDVDTGQYLFGLQLRNITYIIGSIDNYMQLCTIEVDLSYLPLSPQSSYAWGGTYYRLDYDIILLFGLTELKAMVAWKENVCPLGFIPYIFIYKMLSGC